MCGPRSSRIRTTRRWFRTSGLPKARDARAATVPGKAHVEARGGKATIPRAFSLLSPKETIAACLTCHARDLGKVNIRRSEHTLANVACTSCHSVHHSPTPKFLLAKTPAGSLCYGCHAPVRAQFSMPSKHRVNEGFMQCSDCHNPHGSFAPHLAHGPAPAHGLAVAHQ